MKLNEFIDASRDDIISSVQDIVRIPSVKEQEMPGKPFGEEIDKALNNTLALAEKLGFQVKNIDGYAGHAGFGEGQETMGILGHLDVVPEGSGWTYPPYEARIVDGKIYGRGTIDDKGPVIGALYAMKAVMESGFRMKRRVRLIFGTDEESGWKDMELYFQREAMPDFGITPDGSYPIINVEKGILTFKLKKSFPASDCPAVKIKSLSGGHRPNMVPDECSCCFSPSGDQDKILAHLHSMQQFTDYELRAGFCEDKGIEVTAKGVSAHGSTPDKGRNAIAHMLAFLCTLGLGSSEMEQFLLFLNNQIGTDTTGTGLNLNLDDELSGKLSLNLGMIFLDEAQGEAVINIRYPVSFSYWQITDNITKALEGTGVEVEFEGHQPPLHVPEEGFLIETLKQVYTEQTGQTATVMAIGGGTYARAIKNAVAFGAQFPGRPEVFHEKDEYISIEDLILHTKIYAHAIAALCCE
ncbi:MAG: dipeptidase PepV [Clostridia bacterium]|nr:dipeptidase PepV [Clostridia bacterium]MDD4679443.1 dipeptidase PepV [Clostridia bacterium]